MNDFVSDEHASSYREFLCGGWSDETANSRDIISTKDKKELLIFVSSTFTDTHLERDILIEKILPQLQIEARKYDISVTISDMRYGVRDENTKDHKGWLYCKHELERCYQQSAGLFFLSLQGDKYGSRILPRSIDQVIVEERMSEWISLLSSNSEQSESRNHISECIKLFQTWYQLDVNAIPPEYVLKELRTVDDNNFWNFAVPTLREALIGLPCDRECPDIRIGQSITEWETRYALHLHRQKSSDENRLLWIHRQFESGISTQEDISGILIDRNQDENLIQLLSGLLDLLKTHFGSSETDDGIDNTDPVNRRSLLLRCPSSSDYLNVIQRKQLCKMPSIQSVESSFVRQVSIASAEELVSNRSYSSTSSSAFFIGSVAGSMLSREVSHANPPAQQPDMPLQQYLESWEKTTYQSLHHEIIKISQQSKMQLPSSVLQEMLHHCQWAYEKVRTFVGREQLVDEILQKVNAEPISTNNVGQKKGGRSPVKPPRKPIQVALIGASGCGKTALMAHIAQRMYLSEKQQANVSNTLPRPVIVRFCGTSSASTNPLTFLQSLIHQLVWVNDVDLSNLPHEFQLLNSSNETFSQLSFHNEDVYRKHVQIFHHLLQTYPVILLLDSLDQLSNDFEARSRLSFLQGLTHTHARTRIIVSTLPDDVPSISTDCTTITSYFYQCETRLREWEVPCIAIYPFGRNDTDTSSSQEPEFAGILRHILTNQYNRTVTPSQWTYILHQANQEPTALYLQLASRLIATWTSFPSSTSSSLFTELSGGVRHIIHQLFDTLEYTYGKSFTSAALGFITASRSGICDADMCDLISLHDVAMKEIYQYSLNSEGSDNENKVYRAPYHVWTRLRLALKGLLVTKADGGLRWYHRQLQEVAERRYTCVNAFDSPANMALSKLIFIRRIHTCLAKYFANILRCDVRESRLIPSQPLVMEKWNVPGLLHTNKFGINIVWKLNQGSSKVESCTLNIRKLRESSYHISRAITWQLRALLSRNCDVVTQDQVNEWMTPLEIGTAILSMTSLEYIAVLAMADRQGSLLVQLLDDFNLLINSLETFYRSCSWQIEGDSRHEEYVFVEWNEKIAMVLLEKSVEEFVSYFESAGAIFPSHSRTRKVNGSSLFIRLQDYSSWLSANMSLILSDPAKQILYTASRYTAHPTSAVFRDVLRFQVFQMQQQSLATDLSIPVTRRTSSAESYGIPSEEQLNRYSLGASGASNSGKYNRNYISLSSNSHSFPPSMDVPPLMSPFVSTTTPLSFTPLSGLPLRRATSKQGGHSVSSSGKGKRGGKSNKNNRGGSLETEETAFLQVALQYYQLLAKIYDLEMNVTDSLIDPSSELPMMLSPFASRSLARPPTLVGHKNAIKHVMDVSSPINASMLLSHCWSEIRLWDARSGICSTTWHPLVSSTTVDVHANSKKVRAEISCVVVLSNVTFVLVFVLHSVSSSFSYTEVQIWEIAAGRCTDRKRLQIPPGSTAISASANISVNQQPDHSHIVCATINKSGTLLATAASDRSICIWQLPSVMSSLPWELLKVFPAAHRQDISFLSFATRIQGVETLASTSSDKTMKLWLLFVPVRDPHIPQIAGRLILGRCISTLVGHKLPVSCLSFQEFTPSSELAADTVIDSNSIDDAVDNDAVNEDDIMEDVEDDNDNDDFNPKDAIEAFATNRSSSTVQEPLLASAAGNVVKIWAFHQTVASLSNGPKFLFLLRKQVTVPCMATLTGHQGSNIAALQFCTFADQNSNVRTRLLFSCGREDRTIKIWQVAQYPFTCVQQWSAHKSYIADMCLYQDPLTHRQQLVTGSLDKNIKIWDLRRLLTIDSAETSLVKALDSSEEALPGLMPNAQRETSNNGNNNGKITISPRTIPTNTSTTAASFGTTNEDEHRATVTCITVSPDGCFLLSASIDQQICLWDAQTHSLLHVFDHPHGEAEFPVPTNSSNNSTSHELFTPVISLLRFVYGPKYALDDDVVSYQYPLEDTYFVSAIWQNNGSFKVWHACQPARCLRIVQAFGASPVSSMEWDVQRSIREMVVDYNSSMDESNVLYTVSFGGRVKLWNVKELLVPAVSANTPHGTVEVKQSLKEDVFCGMVMNASTMINSGLAGNNAGNSGKSKRAGRKGKSAISAGQLNANISTVSDTSRTLEEDTNGCIGEYFVEGGTWLTTSLVNTVTLLQSNPVSSNTKNMENDAFYAEYYATPPATPPAPTVGKKSIVSLNIATSDNPVLRGKESDAPVLVVSLSTGVILLLNATSGCLLQRLTTQCDAHRTNHEAVPPSATPLDQQQRYHRVQSLDSKPKHSKANQHQTPLSSSIDNAAIDVPFVSPGGNFKNLLHMTSGMIGSQHLISVHLLPTVPEFVVDGYFDERPTQSSTYTVIAAGMMHASDNETSSPTATAAGLGDVPMDSVLWIWYDVNISSSSPMSSISTDQVGWKNATDAKLTSTSTSSCKSKRQQRALAKQCEKTPTNVVASVSLPPHRVFHWQQYAQHWRLGNLGGSSHSMVLEKKDILRQCQLLGDHSLVLMTGGGEVYVLNLQTLLRGDCLASHEKLIKESIVLFDDWLSCVCSSGHRYSSLHPLPLLIGTKNGAILTSPIK